MRSTVAAGRLSPAVIGGEGHPSPGVSCDCVRTSDHQRMRGDRYAASAGSRKASRRFGDRGCGSSSRELGPGPPAICETPDARPDIAIRWLTSVADAGPADLCNHASMAPFAEFHFSCSGALAIEAALKTARDYRRSRHPRVIVFRKSFHGINAYGPMLTDRFESVAVRLDGFPEPADPHLPNPVLGPGGSPALDGADVLQQIDDRLTQDRDRNKCSYAGRKVGGGSPRARGFRGRPAVRSPAGGRIQGPGAA